jgi:prevent-host-death family protein
MGRVTTTKAREEFADTLNRVAFGGERVVLHRHGKDLAAMVPVKDLKLLEELEDRIDLDEARKALSKAKKEGTIAWKKIKADLGL